MRRIFSDHAYGDGPRRGCWWDQTGPKWERPARALPDEAEVAIIGAGFTGLSAAYHLARAGLTPVVLEARYPGWGASGRNGGFCCLGGGMLGDAELDARFGQSERLAFRRAERGAVDLVADLVETLGLDVDRHSQGETELAHRSRDMQVLRVKAKAVRENYGVDPDLIERADLAARGFGGSFHGALTIPIGFAMDPGRYLSGLAAAAERAGAVICAPCAVRSFRSEDGVHRLQTPSGVLSTRHVIVATNGYSSEDIPADLGARYMPAQSSVLVTRPLTMDELARQGWFTDQMCYDTRSLLHYFRLMPDRRFLFGMRGGLMSGPGAEARARRRIGWHFSSLFPAWRDVETDHMWSGMVCLARNRLPFVGELLQGARLWAGLCYHGNGVAMATLSGKILAELVQGREPDIWPAAMRQPLARFPFGRGRRIVMLPIYAGMMLADRG